MAAIAYPELDRRPRPQRQAPRHLVLVPPHRPVRVQAPSRRVALRRRRLMAVAALVLFVLALQLAVHLATAWLGGGSLAVPEPRPAAAAAGSVYVVQPGDTLWTLARRAQPTGDLRPLVGRLAAARDGRPLQAGQRIVLP
jgi:nucleoid-associated protein YgaU